MNRLKIGILSLYTVISSASITNAQSLPPGALASPPPDATPTASAKDLAGHDWCAAPARSTEASGRMIQFFANGHLYLRSFSPEPPFELSPHVRSPGRWSIDLDGNLILSFLDDQKYMIKVSQDKTRFYRLHLPDKPYWFVFCQCDGQPHFCQSSPSGS
jgi:hypothetical protein